MIEFVLNTIFWTLAIYGLFEIIKNIILKMCEYNCENVKKDIRLLKKQRMI